METAEQTSAGGVVWREGPDGREVCLIRPARTRRWQLPKGWIEPGEEPEETAAREILEETGLETEIGPHLETISYSFTKQDPDDPGPVRVDKRVHFYLADHVAGEPTPDGIEIERTRWVAWEEARDDLTFETEKAVLDEAARAIETRDG